MIIPKYFPLLLLICTSPLGAEIHRCAGDDGTVSFSDTPCGREVTALKKYQTTASHDNSVTNIKRDRLLRAFEVERRQAQEREAKVEARRAEREKKCLRARESLAMVQRAGRIYNTDENGNRVVQSDAVRAETEQQAKDYVNHWCD